MSLRVVLVNYAHGTGAGRPEELLDALPALTGWAEALHQAGARVKVLQIFERPASLRRAGVDYLYVPDGPVAGLRRPRRLHRLAARLRPDVVHVNGLLFAPQILDLRWRLPPSAALVVQHHAETPRRGAAGGLEGLAMSRVDGFLFAGRDVAAPWRARIGPQQPVFEVMEGSSSFTPGDRRAARRRTGMEGAPVVFWAGHLDANKDPLTVLAGFERALEALPAARLYMAFLGRDLLGAVESRLRRSDALERAVTLLGRLDHADMEDCFRSADVFVQGSHREGSGFALADAMACGVVPVVTAIPSFRFMTAAESEEAVGALWPPGDAEALAAGLRRVAAGDLEQAGRAARRLFEERLSWPAIGRRALEAYAQVSERRRGEPR